MLLHGENKSIQQTVYGKSDMLNRILPENARLTVEPVKKERDTFRKMRLFQESIRKKQEEEPYRKLSEKLKRLSVKEVSARGRNEKNAAERERMLLSEDEMRQQKIRLRREKKKLDRLYLEQSTQEFFGSGEIDFIPVVVRSQKVLSAFDLAELPVCYCQTGQKPEGTGDDKIEDLCSRPWFTSDFEGLKQMIQSGGPAAIEGGSCLIGNNELQFLLTTEDGREQLFDFNTMRHVEDEISLTETDTSSQLWDFVSANADRIVKGAVRCHKDAITIDEYEEFSFLFYFAKMLQAKLVVTIPDMSYEKTFLQVFRQLKPEVFQPFYDEFMREVYQISDLNLRWIRRFARAYGTEDYVVLHGRAEEMNACFSEGRDRYMQKDVIRKITGRDGMEDAIRDYICMPAMPYYLWGSETILEVNRLEEYPSVEKCRRVHRGLFRLAELMYPQKICANGRTSGFYADRNSKEYLYEKDMEEDSWQTDTGRR